MYGGEIISKNGIVWMSPDVMPLNLVKRVDITINTGSHDHIIKTGTPSNRPIVFLRECFLIKQASELYYLTKTDSGI